MIPVKLAPGGYIGVHLLSHCFRLGCVGYNSIDFSRRSLAELEEQRSIIF